MNTGRQTGLMKIIGAVVVENIGYLPEVTNGQGVGVGRVSKREKILRILISTTNVRIFNTLFTRN